MIKAYYYFRDKSIENGIIRAVTRADAERLLKQNFIMLDYQLGREKYIEQSVKYTKKIINKKSLFYVNITKKNQDGLIENAIVYTISNSKLTNITCDVNRITNCDFDHELSLIKPNCYSHDVITDVITKFYNRVFNTKLDYVDVEFI